MSGTEQWPYAYVVGFACADNLGVSEAFRFTNHGDGVPQSDGTALVFQIFPVHDFRAAGL